MHDQDRGVTLYDFGVVRMNRGMQSRVKHQIRLIHHLPRSGGTLISRCLASMRSVALLSEINPKSQSIFHPLDQAQDWYGLVSDAELRAFKNDSAFEFVDAIKLICDRCNTSGLGELVLRDWSHIDFIGFPFCADAGFDFGLKKALADDFQSVRSVATVRHPIDQYISMRKLDVLAGAWDEEAVWRGIHRFATAIQEMKWLRFEDFLSRPNETLEKLCDWLDIPFDITYETRWHDYRNITGDASDAPSNRIERQPRKYVDEDTWQRLASNREFFETLDILGYPIPARFRAASFYLSKNVLEPDGSHDEGDLAFFAEKQFESGKASYAEGNFDDAIVDLRSTQLLNPGLGQASELLADCLMETGEYDQALVETQRVLRSNPMNVESTRNHIKCIEALGDKFESATFRRRLMDLCPDDYENQFTLANQLTGMGCVEESITLYRDLLDRCPSDGTATNYLLNLNYSSKQTLNEVAKEHFRIAMHFASRPRVNLVRSKPSDGRLRVGYLSSDFYVHPVGKISNAIFENHDRSRFKIVAYFDGRKRDKLTNQIRSKVDDFHDVNRMTDDQLMEQIDRDQIDVLFDLGGYTGGGNRLRVLAQRAAPVQISFLGYPNTTALNTVDYRITDKLADPPGLTDQVYSERSIYLESGFLTWQPYGAVSKIDHHVVNGAPQLGSLNNVAKISPIAIDAWADILRRVPDATLMLKYGDRYGEELVCDRFRRTFAERGIMPYRLQFRRRSETLEGHLSLMAELDLALDSFPYQGTMTSLECLAVGTPIVSLCGEYYAHRATSAMMLRLGFPELVATSTEEYVEIASQLLANPDEIRLLKEEIKERFHSSVFASPKPWVRELEQTLLNLH